MIILTKANGDEYLAGKKFAHLAIGSTTFFQANTKRFREGEGKKLYETLKRFVSSGDFEGILVSNFDLVLASLERADALQWIGDHALEGEDFVLVLNNVDESDIPEFAGKLK